MRGVVKSFIDSEHYQRAVLAAILVNTLSMGIEYHDQVTYYTVQAYMFNELDRNRLGEIYIKQWASSKEPFISHLAPAYRRNRLFCVFPCILIVQFISALSARKKPVHTT